MLSIAISGISKTYPQGKSVVQALSDISLDIKQGELFGLIGPDGAGKTSLFRILTTVLLADSGTAFINGFDVIKDYKEIRKRVGYMPGRFSLYQDLTVEENLQFFATIFNTSIEENYNLIKDIYIQIEPFKKRRAGKLSGGMKQKLALCCALIHRPEVLFLDEPTTGVDAVSRKEFWEMLKRLKNEGITIVVSTPYMDEATLCDRVALIQEGKILKTNTPQTIIHEFGKPLFAIKSESMYPILLELRKQSFIENIYPFGEFHHVILKSPATDKQLLIDFLNQFLGETEFKEIEPDIEDCFIDLMSFDETIKQRGGILS
ncbi:hypothetical protein BH11BAC2_BH11BAC2_03410 [soil metagenome]